MSDNEELDEDKLESLKKLAVEFATKVPESNEGDYFVTVSKRTGFKRLHLVGGCHVYAEKCQQAFAVSSLDGRSTASASRLTPLHSGQEQMSKPSANSRTSPSRSTMSSDSQMP